MPGLTRFAQRFSPEEERILSAFFTNTSGQVFALKNMSETTKAALIARYSRSTALGLRQLFLKEFLRDPETGRYYEGLFEHIDSLERASKFRVGGPRAEKLLETVIAQYGDDSVKDPASASIAFEGVDQLTAKEIEDARLAGFIEKSTRFVDFTNRLDVDKDGFIIGTTDSKNGHFLYKEYPEVQASSIGTLYTDTMDLLFERVKELQVAVSKIIKERMPLEEQLFTIMHGDAIRAIEKFPNIKYVSGIDIEKEEKKAISAYNTAIRAKTFDLTRGVLPASTITNLGMHASFRTFDRSLKKMLASEYPPAVETGELAYSELASIEEPMIKSVKDRHGAEEIKFLQEQRAGLKELARKVSSNIPVVTGKPVKLVHRDDPKQAELRIASASLFPYSQLSMPRIASILRQKGLTHEAISTAVAGRSSIHRNRRFKPPRSFELANTTFEHVGNFGIFRDLQRNRFVLHSRQDLTTIHGYDMPGAIVEAGMESKFRDAMEASNSLYKEMLIRTPKYAQTAVTLAHRLRWIASADLREETWFLELRTGMQGHADYRKLTQARYKKLNERMPFLVNTGTMPWIDMNTYQLERLAAAFKTEQKLEKIKSS